uniref:uncharacterized protein encoded by LINC01551 isoform X2 n=1 Tax=Callithrix jacchus TaxID=9483 RepID=UPI0004F0A00A|nr:uncharacterized protein encoded by LINC01551 isoform X2 [Callithrix jacchus]
MELSSMKICTAIPTSRALTEVVRRMPRKRISGLEVLLPQDQIIQTPPHTVLEFLCLCFPEFGRVHLGSLEDGCLDSTGKRSSAEKYKREEHIKICLKPTP